MSNEENDKNPQHGGKPSLWRLAGTCLRIGATGFGGMMPLLAMAHSYFVEKRPMLSEEEFAEGVALGQMLPGPVTVDAIVYMAYAMRGLAGALVCLISLILPPATLVLILTPLYFAHGGSPVFTAALRGIGAVVIAIVAAAAWRIGKPSIKGWLTVAIAASSFLLLAVTEVSPVAPLLLAGALGALLMKPAAGPDADGAEGGTGGKATPGREVGQGE
jgi:chromate transporter